MMDDKDIFNRVFDKLDQYDERLNSTCNTMTEIKTTLDLFIQSVTKHELEIKQNVESRYKKITAVFGTITCISVLIGIGRAFGVI
ncbi:MAG TPA: hypothetical protein VLE21_04790 [Candidatus Nitrosocosmicus sp.]|nr:hypothetical protein [Candidatus Nitrosocosmicus sp.]